MARTVLLADDSVTAQNMGRRILMDAGYEVITVNNGSAALKKIHESKPDLIVLDVYMPGYGGLEVCQRLKETAETQKIPVLLTVGKMEPFKTEEAKRVKADAHIVKPFDASELLAALTRLEDRIVPTEKRGNGKSKKARFWHSQDPAMTFDDSNSDQIAYLAEVKNRHTETVASEEVSAQAESAAPAPEGTGLIRPAGVGELDPTPAPPEQADAEQESDADQNLAALVSAPEIESTSIESAPAPEFVVEQEPTPEFQAETTSTVEPAPLEPATAYAVATPIEEEKALEEGKSRWVAENVALTAEEASLELEREMHAAQTAAVSSEASVSQTTEVAQESDASELSPSAESAGEQFSPEPATAFAAAAAAGASAVSEVPSIAAESAAEPAVPSEAAAAWENWQHIRDSVMSPEGTAALAESVAEIAQATAPAQPAEPSASAMAFHAESQAQEATVVPPVSEAQGASVDSSEPQVQASSEAVSLESDALASIVDTVLAELKPKLMQEIAKKLKK